MSSLSLQVQVANIFQGIYSQGSRMKLIRNIKENIGNYQKISVRINLELKNFENIGQISNLTNSGEIGNIN
jgi:hypothetical protein